MGGGYRVNDCSGKFDVVLCTASENVVLMLLFFGGSVCAVMRKYAWTIHAQIHKEAT